MDTWINPEGKYNIHFIPKLQKACYRVTYDTKEEWVVNTPEWKMINFKHDYGECKGML